MVGLRGPGERQLEVDRRLLRSKISRLKLEIKDLKRHRTMHRRRRQSLGLPVVALVGYTNAGKSTLLNLLTRARVLAEDLLFATLDPTTRKVTLPTRGRPEILLTDTVGFIQKLPAHLIAAFRATLEEVREADVLLHICDVSNESWRKQEITVLAELEALGVERKPIVTVCIFARIYLHHQPATVQVWNKIDLCPTTKSFLQYTARKMELTCTLSAHTGEGLDDLLSAIADALVTIMVPVEAVIPFSEGSLLTQLHDAGLCESVQYSDTGAHVVARAPVYLARRLSPFLMRPYRQQVRSYEHTSNEKVEKGCYTKVVEQRYKSASTEKQSSGITKKLGLELSFEPQDSQLDVIFDLDLKEDKITDMDAKHTRSHVHAEFRGYFGMEDTDEETDGTISDEIEEEEEDVMDFWRGLEPNEEWKEDSRVQWHETAHNKNKRRALRSVPTMKADGLHKTD
jgi:50S ribosomal subunit-associated GTPase HflX